MEYSIHVFIGILAVGTLPSCVSPNMNLAPDRLVQVIDSDHKQPVKDLPIVYQEFAPFGIIVREVLTSRKYNSDESGHAHVPSGVMLKPAPGSGYVLDSRMDNGKTVEEIESKNTLFVRRQETYMRKLKIQKTNNSVLPISMNTTTSNPKSSQPSGGRLRRAKRVDE